MVCSFLLCSLCYFIFNKDSLRWLISRKRTKGDGITSFFSPLRQGRSRWKVALRCSPTSAVSLRDGSATGRARFAGRATRRTRARRSAASVGRQSHNRNGWRHWQPSVGHSASSRRLCDLLLPCPPTVLSPFFRRLLFAPNWLFRIFISLSLFSIFW